jgi:hypothetical protein
MMDKIVYMKFGSHLYGTDTPQSDVDYKGVFMPERRDVLLGRVPKCISSTTGQSDSKNTADDVDSEIYSLHYFIKLACEGQTVAIDMLHAPENMVLESSDVWRRMVAERHRFYTKRLNAFVGYCRKQAAKYGVKGSRLAAVQGVHDYLGSIDPETRLCDVWDAMPSGEHIHRMPPNPDDKNQYNIYQVCGKQFHETAKAKYVLEALSKFLTDYGHRARLAKENKGVDWKALSHAVRAALQVREILQDGTVTFPLKQAEIVKDIKQGTLDYTTVVAPMIESLMDEVETLSIKSTLPDVVDAEYWDDFIVTTLNNRKD